MDQAYASMRKLAQLDFETVLVARGEPILEGGAMVMELVASAPTP